MLEKNLSRVFFNSYYVKIYSLFRRIHFLSHLTAYYSKGFVIKEFNNLRSSAIGFGTEIQLYYVFKTYYQHSLAEETCLLVEVDLKRWNVVEVCDIHPSLSIKLRVISHNDTSYFGNYHSHQSYPLIKILNKYSALRVLRFINNTGWRNIIYCERT